MKLIITESQLSIIVNNTVISEEQIGSKGINGIYGVYKNPSTIRKFDMYARGLLMSNGDLFIVDNGYHVIHGTLGHYLRSNGYTIPVHLYNHPEFMVPIQRKGKTNDFYLGEGYSKSELNNDDIMGKIMSTLSAGKAKNPQFNFISKSIEDSYSFDN